MKFLIALSALWALASASSEATCEDCQAVVITLADLLTSPESIANQVQILIAEVCLTLEDPEECIERMESDFWSKVAMVLWPGYFNADAEWMCATEDFCGAPGKR